MAETMAIDIEHVNKSYGDFSVLKDLSLHVGKGEVYGFLGLNGAGKSTTIKLLLGMNQANSGTIEILGQPAVAGNYDLWGKVGYLEEPTFYPYLTVAENLEIARKMQNISDKSSVDRVIEQLKLTAYRNKKAKNLSLGNKQRLCIGKALINNPEILILDEPINGLDPAGIVEIRDLIKRLSAEEGVTIFMSSHLMGEISKVATRIGILNHGRLIEEVKADELIDELHRYLQLDSLEPERTRDILVKAGFQPQKAAGSGWKLVEPVAVSHPEKITELLVKAGNTPTQVNVVTEDLETFFLRKISKDDKEETLS